MPFEKGSTSGGKKGKGKAKKGSRPLDLVCEANRNLPLSVDWRDLGWRQRAVNGKGVIMSSVKYQGKLQTCVVNTVSTLVETACNVKYFQAPGYPVTLSVQELLDWVKPDDIPNWAVHTFGKVFRWIKANKLCLEENYKYDNNGAPHTSPKVKDPGHRLRAKGIMRNHKEEYKVDEQEVLRLVTQKPVAGVILPLKEMKNWDGKEILLGTPFDDGNTKRKTNEESSAVMHAVLIVGYGTDPTTNTSYWLVRSSWGDKWGDHGYGRMARAISRPDGRTLLNRVGIVEGSED